MTVSLPITREKLFEAARSLPAAPQVLGGLCELLQDCNSSLDTVADQIRMDASLSARVIRVSNSPVFGSGRRIASVDEAVNRVGFSEIIRLVGVATVSRFVEADLTSYGIGARQLRESVLMHAVAAEALAEQGGRDPRVAYTAGLLRAVGLMVLDRMGRDRLTETQRFNPFEFETYGDWEGEHFGVSHPEITAMIFEEWRFDPLLVKTIRDHLQPSAVGGASLATTLNLAGGLVVGAGLALPGETAHWGITPAKLAAAEISTQALESAGEAAYCQFRRLCVALD